MDRARSIAILCGLVLGFLAPQRTPAGAAEDAWGALASLRSQIQGTSPLVADFEQTFVAAGFSTGDAEEGRISMDLPECIRWDYSGDFPKTFLLCGHVAYTWNQGEASGRRQFLGPEEQPGLELLRLEIDELRLRYRARLAEGLDGPTVELVPFDNGSPSAVAAGDGIRDAKVTISQDGTRLRALSYHDREGNLTRFEFTRYRTLEGREVFEPPA
ncbi:MAG: outer membrane lipoprotein carrier protein LolA, partial [Acidobacteriota bacterium]|nr:outer membrane lipoprotein carrier protein LolA [Acidobacteriota bacterium]